MRVELPYAIAEYYRLVDGGAIAEMLAGLADEPCFVVPTVGAPDLAPLASHRGRAAVVAMFERRGILPIRHVPTAAAPAGDRWLISGSAFDPAGTAVADFFVTAGLDERDRLASYVGHATPPQRQLPGEARCPSDDAFERFLGLLAGGAATAPTDMLSDDAFVSLAPLTAGAARETATGRAAADLVVDATRPGRWRQRRTGRSPTAGLAAGTIELDDGAHCRVACRVYGGPDGRVAHVVTFANALEGDDRGGHHGTHRTARRPGRGPGSHVAAPPGVRRCRRALQRRRAALLDPARA